MTDEKHGPASFAATALAGPPGAPAAEPSAPVVSGTVTTHGLPRQSGVGPASAAAPESAGPIGRTIHGRYRIKRLLGEGGMGGVYEGEHLEIGKRVAIKLVHALHARDPHIAARIKQEARSTGAIESENIVQVFDAGEDVELGIFLVMEMLRGEDLGSLLARRHRVSPLAAATLVVQAAQGLSRAHAAGIVHRDLKPANIFLCTRDDGSSLVKLVDFGIAKLVRDANRTSTANAYGTTGALTRMGMVIGTPQYMSPEQAQGLLSVDHRTDIYSLGAVLYEAIVGTSPYLELPTYEQTILQIMTRPAPRLSSAVPDINPELDQLCAEMMAHDPAARPRDMLEVRARLVRIFPEIEGARLPMGSLTNEVGYDKTLSADTTGQLQARVNAARAALSGVRPASGMGAALQAVEAASAPLLPALEEEQASDVAGVPPRRRGLLIGVVAVVALAAGVAAVALVKTQVRSPASAASTAPGLAPPAVTAAIATTRPAPVVVPLASGAGAPSVAGLPPGSASPSAPSPSAVSAKSVRSEEATKSLRSPKPVKPTSATAAPSSAASADKVPSSPRPVGGTSESTEF